MFGHVLIATDDSPLMESAMRYTATLFPRSAYHLLTVIDTSQSKLPKSDSVHTRAHELSQQTIAHSERVLADYKIMPRGENIVTGHASSIILNYAAKGDIELLVMGEGSKFGVQRLQLGTTCIEVLEAIKCPVLLLNEPVEAKVPTRILNPTTGSSFSDSASELAILVADQFKAKLMSVFVGKPRHAKETLDKVEMKAEKFDLDFETVTAKGKPADEILRYSRESDIMVASRGRCGFIYKLRRFHKDFALGRLEREVLIETKIPLILVGD